MTIMMADVWEEFTHEERKDVLRWVKAFPRENNAYKHIHMGTLPFVSFSKLLSITLGYDMYGIRHWMRIGAKDGLKTPLEGALHIVRVADKLGLNKLDPMLKQQIQEDRKLDDHTIR